MADIDEGDSRGKDDIFSSEDSRDVFQLSKADSLTKSSISRSYRSRDKASYGDSHLADIDGQRRERKKRSQAAPPSSDETRQGADHHRGNRPASRRQDEGSIHQRHAERKMVKHRSHREGEYRLERRRKHSRSRSRSPRHPTRPHTHSGKSLRPGPAPHMSDPPVERRVRARSHERYRRPLQRNTRSRTTSGSDSERGPRRNRSEEHPVSRLVRDLESSTSSDSEGEVTTPTPPKDKEEMSANKEMVKVSPKMTWKDITFTDSEEEEDEERRSIDNKRDTSSEGDTAVQLEEVSPENEVETFPPEEEEVKEEEVAEEAKTPEPIEEEVPSPELPQSPETEEKLPPYLPAMMGCRSVECYEWLNRIEEGTYGVVFRAKDNRTGEIVALKKLKMEKEREGFPITSLREISTLLKVNHENIVNVREIVVGSNMDKIFIVMDYVEHDLKSLMETMKQPFLEGEVKTLLMQLLKAVHHLHDNWILHRDLKTSNLLLSHKGILKVADFGLAREYGSPLKPYTPIVVTLWYRAPELLLGAKEYSTAIDVWSVGCIFAELLQHKPIFMGKSEIDQLNQIFKELGLPNDKIWPDYEKLPVAKKVHFAEQPLNNLRRRFPVITNNGFNLLNRFFTYDPKRRITADEALKQEYFQESPLPVDPSMFPTWPAKSEMVKKTARAKSPTAPEGGAFFHEQQAKEDDEKFHLPAGQAGKAGPGFTLKF